MTQEKSFYDILLDRSIPKFIKSEYPIFASFLEAYFEFMQQEKNTHDVAINLRNYRDIDDTLDEFLSHFVNEYLINIPKDILADKRKLAKIIKTFYQNKGNEESYKFLFRLLYNEDVDFYYPKTDVLRASDSIWYNQRSLKVTSNDPLTISTIRDKKILGLTSGATAIAENVIRLVERGEVILEVDVSDIIGEFQHGETIAYLDDEGNTIEEVILQVYNSATITVPGAGYVIDDVVTIKDENQSTIGFGRVEQVTKGPITGLTIAEGGSGYRGDFRQVTSFANLPIESVWEGINLPTATIEAQDSNDYDFSVEQINFTIDAYLLEDVGDIIRITDSSTSAGSGASGRVIEVDANGAIVDVELTSAGQLYESPLAEVVSDTGTGAEIDVSGGGGAISSVKFETFPVFLESDLDSNGESLVTLDFTQSGDGTAEGVIQTGTLLRYPGRYLSETGHLSSDKKLQDNFYYQDFSYVLKVERDFNQWKDIVKKAIHPAGFAMFGEVTFLTRININNINIIDEKTIQIVDQLDINNLSCEESIYTIYELDSNGEEFIPS